MILLIFVSQSVKRCTERLRSYSKYNLNASFDRDQWGTMIDFMTDAMCKLERAIKEPLKQAVEQVKNDSSE